MNRLASIASAAASAGAVAARAQGSRHVTGMVGVGRVARCIDSGVGLGLVVVDAGNPPPHRAALASPRIARRMPSLRP